MRSIISIYTTVIVLIPILTIYGSFISVSLSLLDVLLMLLLPFCIYAAVKQKGNSIAIPICLYIIYILVVIFSRYIFEIQSVDILFRAFRYLFYLLFLALFSKNLFDLKLACRLLVWISVFSTIYLIIQLVFINVFGFYFSGYIPFLDLMREELYEFGEMGVVDRPRSIFLEPASYASYMCFTLICVLFSDIKIKKYVLFFLCFGIIASASTSGIVYLLFIALIYVMINRKTIRIKWQYILAPVIVLLVFFVLGDRMDLIANRLEEGRSYDGRMSGYEIVNTILLSDTYFLFGHGFVNVPEDVFLAGWVRMLYYLGLAGVLVFLFILFYFYCGGNRLGKVLVLFTILSAVAGASILSSGIMLNLTFVLVNKKFR